MESFYGGRQGASIVIKARFKYVTDQTENGNYIDPYYGIAYNKATALPEGTERTQALNSLAAETMTVQLSDPNYTEVWYNEYCIIDPDNKNNTNNGQIYRRTLKSSNDEDPIGSVAEYIGQIVGPAGSSPQLGDFTSVTALQNSFAAERESLDTDDVLTYVGINDEWTVATPGHLPDTPMKIQSLGSAANFIPGNNTTLYTDNTITAGDGQHYIQHGGYGWYNIRKNTDTSDVSKVYLGFDIPYYVTEFARGQALDFTASPALNKTINTTTAVKAPFYEKYLVDIPRGVTGGWLNNFRFITTTSANQYYAFTAANLTYTPSTGTYTRGSTKATNAKGQDVWLADFSYYKPDGSVATITNFNIGIRKEIRTIEFDTSDTLETAGTLKITLTDNNVDTFTKALTSIKTASLDANNNLSITFNNNNIAPISVNLKTVTSINLANDGTLTFGRSDGTSDVFSKKVQWVDSVTVDNNKNLKIHLNTAASSTYAVNQNLNIYTDVSYTDSTGVLQLVNSNPNLSISAVVRTIQQGLYVNTGTTVTVATSATTAAIVSEANTVLSNAHASTTQAQIVNVKYGNTSNAKIEAVVFYYDTTTPSSWKILGSTGGSSTGAALAPATTSIPYDPSTDLILETTAIAATGTLSSYWLGYPATV